MSEVWIAAENGWYIKSPGYMKAEPDYQKIDHKKAADSIERGNAIVFTHINQGRETESRTYVQNGDVSALEEAAKRMNEHIKQTCDICDEYYCGNWDDDNSCCVFDTMLRELGIEVSDASGTG